MQIWHLTFSTDGRNPSFPDEQTRRTAIRTLARVAGDKVVLFSFVDDHNHVVLMCTTAERARLGQALHAAFNHISAAPLLPAHVKPVHSRSHLNWLVEYLLTQVVKHGLLAHPATWSGSCFPDIVGARRIPTLQIRLHEALPRFRVGRAYHFVGLPNRPLVPATDEEIWAFGAPRLAAAAAAAHCAGPVITDKSRPSTRTRDAFASLATRAGFSTSDIRLALNTSGRSARRLATRPPDPHLEHPVRMRLALETAVAASPPIRLATPA